MEYEFGKKSYGALGKSKNNQGSQESLRISLKKNDFVVVQDAMMKNWTPMVKYQPGWPKMANRVWKESQP